MAKFTQQGLVLTHFLLQATKSLSESDFLLPVPEIPATCFLFCLSVAAVSCRGATSSRSSVRLLSVSRLRLQDSEFVCLEFDEDRANQVLKKMADIQRSIDSIVHRS